MSKRKKPTNSPAEPVKNVRIDPPHPAASAGQPQPHGPSEHARSMAFAASENEITAESAVMVVQQVRKQAEQLATHLRKQQATIDHRESELNARLATVDNETRSARLWLQEHQHALTESEQKLAERIVEFESRLRNLAVRENELADIESLGQHVVDRRETDLEGLEAERHDQWQSVAANMRRQSAELQTREQILESRRNELLATEQAWKKAWDHAQQEVQQRQSELAADASRISARGVELEQHYVELDGRLKQIEAREHKFAEKIARGEHADELTVRCEHLEARKQHVDAAEALLYQQQLELDLQRRELEADRADWQQQCAADRQQLADDQRRTTAELEKKRQTLERRSDDLDARRAALKQLRGEVKRVQRETLEMRLATEELWARLCGTMAPAALTQSLAQIRSRIADELRLEQVELAEQAGELDALRSRITEQNEKLEQTRAEMHDWAKRRQQEIETQAARLVAREQELDRQETDFGKQAAAWQSERRGYEQEIRKLMRQLRGTHAVAA